MKVVKKSPSKRRAPAARRATLTVDAETYRRIDTLRNGESRSGWIQELVRREEERIERKKFLAQLEAEYTPEVCRQTLKIHAEYPIHDE
jgi:hypothetical protein